VNVGTSTNCTRFKSPPASAQVFPERAAGRPIGEAPPISGKEAQDAPFYQGRFRHQVQSLRRQFLQNKDLPFTDVLSEDLVAQTLTTIGVFWNDRIYTPLVTLWSF
jgi:hypothetical protein